MNRTILSIVALLALLLLLLVFVFPKFYLYFTSPNIAGGCFDICEKEVKLGCTGDLNNMTNSFATCAYLCIGEHQNNCE